MGRAKLHWSVEVIAIPDHSASRPRKTRPGRIRVSMSQSNREYFIDIDGGIRFPWRGGRTRHWEAL
jgi:hypothetical protein